MAHPLTSIQNFSYDTLNKELELTAEERKDLDTFYKAYMDDFWQEGKGTLLPPATGPNSSQVDTLFQKRFVFRNVIRECVSRVAGAFFGKSPNWKFQLNGEGIKPPAPPAQDQPPVTDPLVEIEKALGDFWTKQNVAEALGKAFESRLAFGRGGIRIFIPTKFKRQNLAPQESEGEGDPATNEQLVTFPDILTAIRAMRVEFIPPTQGRLLDDGGDFFSIVKYAVRKDWNTQDTVGVIEFSFVDNSEMTFIGTLEERGTVTRILDANLSSAFDLDGWPTYNEFKGFPYVTQALYKNNQLLNLALTCAGFSLVDNGFGEMVLTNVELETESITGADGETVEVPKRIKRGGGATQNFMGVEIFDESTGAVQRSTPGVTFKDPSPMTAFKDGASLAYMSCLQEAGQLYALIAGDATATGESRIQALADFVLKIRKYKSEIDEQGGWLLTSVLLWAAALCNQASNFVGYSVVFDSRIHAADVSTEEKNIIMSMRQKGVISRETERVLLGVDDPALESELIHSEQDVAPDETTVEQFSEKLDVGLKMLSVGIDNQTIQEFLGYTQGQLTAIQNRAAEAEATLLANIEAQQQGGTGASTGA